MTLKFVDVLPIPSEGVSLVLVTAAKSVPGDEHSKEGQRKTVFPCSEVMNINFSEDITL